MAGDDKPKEIKKAYWLIYIALLIGGALLIADASQFAPLQKVTAKLGIGMVYSAFALFVGNGRAAGYIATVIIWGAVLATFLVH